MALLQTLTLDQLTAIRSGKYQVLQFVCLVPNTVIVQFHPDTAPTTAVYAEIVVDTPVLQGNMSNIRAGMTVIYSTTSDYQATETFRTRVRKVSGTATLYVGENSQSLTTTDFVTVINTYEVQERLRKSETYADWDIPFRLLLPIDTALPSAVVLTNGETEFSPVAAPIWMDASATAIDTHAWESSNSNDTLDSGGTTNNPTFTLQAGSFRWIRYTFTDDNDNSNYRVIPVWTVPRNYSSVVALGFVGQGGDVADIDHDPELGWTATVPAWTGIEDVLNKTLCVIASDEWYDDTRQSIRTNINFVGYLQNESTPTSGDADIGKQSETRFTVEGFGHQLARQNIAPIRITRVTGTPSAWNQIQNPTPARMLSYHLTEGSTIFNLCSMTIPDDDTDFVGDDLSITGGKALDDARFITEVINAELQFDVNGRLDLCRNLNFQDDTARDAADVVMTLLSSDILSDTPELDYSKTVSQVTLTGGAYNTSVNRYDLYEAISPAVARRGEGDPLPISNQVLVTNSTTTEATAELGQRAANYDAANNPTWVRRVTLIDELHFLVPDIGSWFYLPIAAADTARGIVFSETDRWQLVQISTSTNSETGRRTVSGTFRRETRSTGAMVRASQIQNDPLADILYLPAVLPPYVGANLDYTDGAWYDSKDPAPPSDPTPVDATCQSLGLRPKSGDMVLSNPVLTSYVSVRVLGYGRIASTGATVTVSAKTNPFSGGGATGVNVTSGQSVTFTATGGWSHAGYPPYSANGVPGLYRSDAMLPSAQIGALIGKVGSGGSWFLIGASNTLTMPATGELYLAMNDRNIYGDNSGTQSVLVGAVPIIGDSFYFSDDDGATWEAYDTGNGLEIEGGAPNIPPFNPSHEYFFPALLVTGLATVQFEFTHADYDLNDFENWNIQITVCETDDPV